MDARRVNYRGKWDCDMTHEELLALVAALLADKRWKAEQFLNWRSETKGAK